MKSVTEFPSWTLSKGLQAKTALVTEGKTAEEIQTSLGETFKYEGDKLKHFVNALDVAGQNTDKLRRVLVVSYTEGEAVPPKATKVDEHHYVPEFLVEAKPAQSADPKGGGKGRGKGKGGPKGSPWGLSPEEKALKNKGPAKAAATEKSDK